MGSQEFRFKRFAVEQAGAAMKVGTDGVLLGAWMDIPKDCRRILDIGTGTGLIALMAAQRTEEAYITGVEIDASSAEQARTNVAASEWSGRIEIVAASVQEYSPQERFDLIVSNPPYYDGTLTCPNDSRTTARHTVSLSFGELAAAVMRLLAPEGRFAVIIPSESVKAMVAALPLHLVRRCDVRTKPSGAPKRTMLEFSPRFCGPAVYEELTIGDGAGGYDERYRALTADFYLDF